MASSDESSPSPTKHSHGHRGRGQGRGRGGRGRGEDSPTVALSKALSWLLRHNAISEGLTVDHGGWVDLDAVLGHRKFKQWTVEDVKKVVAENDKQRFSLRGGDEGQGQEEPLQIRANQGHSFVGVIDDTQLLEVITDPGSLPTVLHGTYRDCWDAIKVKGLSRMGRNHIHFATGEVKADGVISGMRSSSQIHIYVDIAKAMQDGIKFYRSANNVILSSGNEDGFIEPKYFLKVLDAKSKKNLLL